MNVDFCGKIIIMNINICESWDWWFALLILNRLQPTDRTTNHQVNLSWKMEMVQQLPASLRRNHFESCFCY